MVEALVQQLCHVRKQFVFSCQCGYCNPVFLAPACTDIVYIHQIFTDILHFFYVYIRYCISVSACDIEFGESLASVLSVQDAEILFYFFLCQLLTFKICHLITFCKSLFSFDNDNGIGFLIFVIGDDWYEVVYFPVIDRTVMLYESNLFLYFAACFRFIIHNGECHKAVTDMLFSLYFFCNGFFILRF